VTQVAGCALGDVRSSPSDDAEQGVQAVVALGSNLGDRLAHLAAGAAALRDLGTVLAVSHVYETKPEGPVPQPPFLNAVGALSTTLAPVELLQRLLEAEKERGRVRDQPGGPRTLDLDLLFYGNLIIRRPGLTVPHPRWKARAFVCIPLLEILPAMVDPESGLAIRELCGVGDAPAGKVERYPAPGWAE